MNKEFALRYSHIHRLNSRVAAACGIPAALIYQYIWDRRLVWEYGESIADLQTRFPYLSLSSIRRALRRLCQPRKIDGLPGTTTLLDVSVMPGGPSGSVRLYGPAIGYDEEHYDMLKRFNGESDAISKTAVKPHGLTYLVGSSNPANN